MLLSGGAAAAAAVKPSAARHRLGSTGRGRTGAIAENAIQWSDHLHDGHEVALRTYGGIFLEFLDAAAPMRGRQVSLPHSSKVVDRSVMLHNIAPDAVMKVAAALHFVRLKLTRHTAAQMQQAGTAAPAPFLIKGGANTGQTWLRKFTVVRPAPPAVCVRLARDACLVCSRRGYGPRRYAGVGVRGAVRQLPQACCHAARLARV